jgi:putative PIN family toxin of toxin-antitoxin system
MNIVLDCNIVISAAWNNGLARRVVLYALEHCTIIVSDLIIDEFLRVSDYDKLAKKKTHIKAYIEKIREEAVEVPHIHLPLNLIDQSDVIYISAAVSGDADMIVTGNIKHFPPKKYGSIRILSVRDFAVLVGIESEC